MRLLPTSEMRRLFRQSAALGLALLFGASLAANAFGWHGCPHHGHDGRAADPPPASATSGSPDDPLLAIPGAGHDPGPSPGACTCLGSCHAGSATALSPDVDLAVADEAAVRTSVRRPSTHRPRRRPPAYFLPFPHGPPALG